MGPKFRHRTLWAAAVAVVCLAAACSGDGGGDRSSASGTAGPADGPTLPPGWDLVDETPELPSLDVGERLWGSDEMEPIQSISRVALHGDAVILDGLDAGDHQHLAVVDGPSGQLRWSVEAFDDLPGGDGATWHPSVTTPDNILVLQDEELAVAGDDEWVVLVNYQLAHAEDAAPEYGIAALSGDDGRVLWKTPTIPSQPGSESATSDRRAPGRTLANGGLAVTGVLPDDPTLDPSNPDVLNRVDLAAVDVANGRPLWQQTGAWPVGVTDGAVFALVPDDPTEASTSDPLPVTTVALDPATGERLWDLSDRHPTARLVLTAGDAAVMELMDSTSPSEEESESGSETLILDAASGDELASFGTGVTFPDDCGADDSLIACGLLTDPSEGLGSLALATFDVEERDPGVAARTFEEVIDVDGASFGVRGVAEGRVFVGALDHASVTLDRAGQGVDPELSGVLLAVSDRFLIVEEPGNEQEPATGEDPPYTVHAVSAGS